MAISLKLYNIFLWLITENLSLNLSTCFSPLPTLGQPPVCSLYLWLCICLVMFVHLLYFFTFPYKWTHTVFVILCLTYFTYHNTIKIHLYCHKWQDVPFFYDWVIFFSFLFIFFIHSSISGYLGCFNILAIVNNVAVNIRVCMSFQISVFLFFR